MGLYQRRDSPYWWMSLARPGQRALLQSTGVPIDGGTRQQTSRNRKLAQEVYSARIADLIRDRYQLPTTPASSGCGTTTTVGGS